MKFYVIVKKTVPVLLFITVITVFVFVAQLGQHLASVKDAKMHTIALWSEKSPENKKTSDLYISECLMPKMIDSSGGSYDKKPIIDAKNPISIYDCGNNIGARELMIEIEKTGDSMKTLIFPLSIVNYLGRYIS